MKKFLILVFAGIVGGLITFGGLELLGLRTKVITLKQDTTPTVNTKYTYSSGKLGATLDFTQAAEQAMNAVVHIKSTERASSRQNYYYDPFREFFGEDFFFHQQPQQREKVGTGSGVILSQDGYIITNNHVIDNADKVEVSLHDNRTFDAIVVGTDPSSDLALIKIDCPDLSPISITNSDEVKVGEFVLAVGNPFNLTSTVTAGIVSAKARSINILKGKRALEAFIQTDAAVNPGNSGGALVNTRGELIGINSAIASPTGAYAGYSFAIPSNIVLKVYKDLKEYGVVQRAYIGVQIQALNGELAKKLDLDITEGVYVAELMENSSAEEAGIKAGDVIIRINENEIKQPAQLQEIIGKYSPGEKVKVVVNRDGDEKEFEVILKNFRGNTDIVKKGEMEVRTQLGAEFEDLSRKELKKLKLSSGIRVKTVEHGHAIQRAGIKEGFIILSINGEKTETVKKLYSKLQNKKGGVLIEGIYEGYPRVVYYALELR